MFGQGWWPSTGVVLDSRVTYASVSESSGSSVTRELVVAVLLPGGETADVTVPQGGYSALWAPRIGQSVKVEISAKGDKVRLDKSDLGISFAEHERRQRAGPVSTSRSPADLRRCHSRRARLTSCFVHVTQTWVSHGGTPRCSLNRVTITPLSGSRSDVRRAV